MQAFVPLAAAPVQAPLLRGALAQDPAALPAPVPAGVGGVAPLGALALAAAGGIAIRRGSARKARRARGATARRAEAGTVDAGSDAQPFAGGLLGGESAFASGDYNFDPLGIADRCPQYLPWFREAELKHGRVAMLAWTGLVVPELVRIPGPANCYTASAVDAHSKCVVTEGLELGGPLFQVFLLCGLIEMTTTYPKVCKTGNGLNLENAGDYKVGLGFLPKGELKQREMKLKELKNGRLAMIAFGGAITQAVLSGNSFPWLYAAGRPERPSGLSSGVPAARRAAGMAGGRATARVSMKAEEGGYKMSKSVPFLPASPALEGYVGEEDGFDPIGMSLAYDIRWLREAELKHARVAMLALVGWVTTDLGFRIPGEPFQLSTIDAHDQMVKFGAMPQMLVWAGYFELFGFLAIINMMEGKTDRKPGDFGIRAWYPKDEKRQYEMQLKELRNGRLAMLAFAGTATAGAFSGQTWPFFGFSALGAEGGGGRSASSKDSSLCGGLRRAARRQPAAAARRAEVSRSMPFLPKPQNLAGYVGEEQEFDPLGFSDTFDMKWLREAELKHGRVCMLATVGFAAQQYATFPGMSPTPNALQAVYTETNGLIPLIFLAGYIESVTYDGKITMLDMFEGREDKVPGDFNFGAGFLKGKSDKEVYDMKLKELNNGRLAMLAFGGMVHHNLVVNGPLFPIFPDGWQGPQGTWSVNGFPIESVASRLVEESGGNSPIGVQGLL